MCDGESAWGEQSIMVWGAIGINHKAGPGRGNGVTALRCNIRILRLHVAPYHQQHNIRIIPWPALSPNPIKHLWDEIQRKLNEVLPRSITAADLSVAFLRIWAAIPMTFSNRLIHSMYRRCVSLGDTRGIDS